MNGNSWTRERTRVMQRGEVGVLERLGDLDALGRVDDEHLLEQVDGVPRGLGVLGLFPHMAMVPVSILQLQLPLQHGPWFNVAGQRLLQSQSHCLSEPYLQAARRLLGQVQHEPPCLLVRHEAQLLLARRAEELRDQFQLVNIVIS